MDNEHTFTVDLNQPVVTPVSQNLGSYKSNYRKNLPSKIEQIEALISSDDENRLDNLKRLYVKFYHLAGTSGTFGIPEISEEAGKLVSLLQPVIDTDEVLQPELYVDLEKGIEALRTLALRASTKDIDFDTPKVAPTRSEEFQQNTQLSDVFLVDGDSDFTRYMTALLEKLGHRVYAFDNPQDLLTVSKGIRPKAIIIDLILEDGVVEGARVIKEVQKHQKSLIPVIFTSFRDDIQARILAAGAFGTYFFKKPINEDRLLLTLDRIAFSPQTFNERVLIINSHLARGDKQLDIFQKNSIETVLVRDPLQIMEAMEEYNPDQLIIETAQLNSFQLAKAIRQHEAYQNTPITIISGAPYETASLLAAEAGVDTLIPSSTPPDYIVRIIKGRSNRLNETTPEAKIWQA